MSRLYSVLTVKRLDEHAREIFGIASTGETDRAGDIVEPLGLKAPPRGVSLLWQHDHGKPIGWATFDPPTAKGVTFRAKLPKPTEPSPFRDLVEMAWGALVAQTVRGVSIGFRALATEPLPTGGLRFKAAELLELSLVSVPANASATVTSIKRYAGAGRVVRLDDPVIDRKTGKVVWAPKKAAHRVVRLDAPPRTGRDPVAVRGKSADKRCPVSSAILKASDEFERSLATAKAAKTLGSTEALLLQTQAEAALATDDALAELRDRLAKLEGK